MPAKAYQNVTYIDGNTGLTYESRANYVGATDVPVGKTPAVGGTIPAYTALSGNIPSTVFSDPKLGYATDRHTAAESFRQVYPTPASGYTTLGVPTSGNGFGSGITSWGDDKSNNVDAKFVYTIGGSGITKAYNALSS